MAAWTSRRSGRSFAPPPDPWLMEQNGEPLPEDLIPEIRTVAGGEPSTRWWTGSSVDGQSQLSDEAVDWIETVANADPDDENWGKFPSIPGRSPTSEPAHRRATERFRHPSPEWVAAHDRTRWSGSGGCAWEPRKHDPFRREVDIPVGTRAGRLAGPRHGDVAVPRGRPAGTSYCWLTCPATDAGLVQACQACAVFDAHRGVPEAWLSVPGAWG